MCRIERLGRDEVTDRDLFFLKLPRIESLPDSFNLPSPHFAGFLAWDPRGVPVSVIDAAAKKLLAAGAVYVCAWGPDCERVHDIVDEVSVELDLETGSESTIMTTQHDREPLDEALFFLLRCAIPDEKFHDTCRSSLGIAVGNDEWAERIRSCLAKPEEFLDELLAADGENPEKKP